MLLLGEVGSSVVYGIDELSSPDGATLPLEDIVGGASWSRCCGLPISI